MADALRVGLVGANADGRGWGAMTHLPAIQALPNVELAALCTSRPESAAQAEQAYGIRTFHDVRELAAQPDIDLIAAVVRVPRHRDVVIPALEAGKNVFCEWPLGVDHAEAREMADLARSTGVVTGVGLQGRHDPALTHVKQLHEDGWLGDVLSVRLTMVSGGAGRSDSRSAWMGDASNAANPLTIVAGHCLDHLAYCLGPIAEVAARVTTQVPEWHLADTGETISVDAPDSVVVAGTLVGGAELSFHMASVPHNGTGWRMAVHGTRGTLVATTGGLPQIAPIRLRGALGEAPLADLPIPAHPGDGSTAMPAGPAANVARTYHRMAEALRTNAPYDPGFDEATALHGLLDALQRSSTEGRAISIAPRRA